MKSTAHPTRRAFSIVELLISIGIVGLLIGLLIPAIQKVRQSAESAKCKNQIRQIGFASVHYHDSFLSLPMGIVPNQTGRDFPYLTWLARTLPYIEQDALWQITVADYLRQRNPFRGGRHQNLSQPVDPFVCPIDPRGAGPHSTNRNRIVAVTSYLGNIGTNHLKKDGVFQSGQTVRFGSIMDGLSTTLMVGERPPAADFWYGWWYAGVGMNGSGSPDSLLAVREVRSRTTPFTDGCASGPYHFESAVVADLCSVFHFWSLHPGGANFAMCDGSVHFLSYSADKILPALATRAGNEAVELP